MDTQAPEQQASTIELPDVILGHIDDTNELLDRMDLENPNDLFHMLK